MVTAVYFSAVIVLVVLAVERRHDWCAWALAGGLAASMLLAGSGAWSIMPGAAAIDALTCIIMLLVWTRFHSMRAWSIGFIGLAKGVAHFAQYMADAQHVSWPYFVAINGAFVAQVLVAGGWADAVGDRADRVFARLAPVRHRLLRYGD